MLVLSLSLDLQNNTIRKYNQVENRKYSEKQHVIGDEMNQSEDI